MPKCKRPRSHSPPANKISSDSLADEAEWLDDEWNIADSGLPLPPSVANSVTIECGELDAEGNRIHSEHCDYFDRTVRMEGQLLSNPSSLTSRLVIV
jgi:hypothetical protein